MTEIELKAHVKDPESIKKRLSTFASFQCYLEKKDTYFHIPSPLSEKGFISVRIRREAIQTSDGNSNRIVFTYKKKENRISNDGIAIEVNEENETELSDDIPLIKAITDAGGVISLQKQKKSYEYHYETPFGTANIELVEVEKLGWFLEIEIVGEEKNASHVEEIKTEIEKLIQKAGLPLETIEPRYYSEMLSEINKL